MAVIVWFRPSCVSCIFIYIFYFLYFGSYGFLSVVLLFYGSQFNGVVPFNCEINMMMMMMMIVMMMTMNCGGWCYVVDRCL